MMEHYISYNNPKDVRSLNMNDVNVTRQKISVFPGYIYQGEVFPDPDFLEGCGPRDTRYNYIIDRERLQHPQHFSRFSYLNFPNEHGTGIWPGRYNEAPLCSNVDMPADMAPAQYYVGPYASMCKTYGQTYIEARQGRDHIDNRLIS
jgi:hypothetical protein